MKDNYSTKRKVHTSPRTSTEPVTLTPPVVSKSGTLADVSMREEGTGGAAVPPRRGSGLRNLLGTDGDEEGEKERERSRIQGEALKKQVEDNKVR